PERRAILSRRAMRRPLVVSALFHLALFVLVWIGLSLEPHQFPLDVAISVEVLQVEPHRVQAHEAPPAEAAPLPKREAAAVDPAPRSEPSRAVEAPTPLAPS